MSNKGKITQIIGPVVDVSFENEGNALPDILDALEVTKPSGEKVIFRNSNSHWRKYSKNHFHGFY